MKGKVGELYEELGVDRGASTADVKRAYRRKARVMHPDAGGDPKAFIKLNRAYLILSNAVRRSKYDESGQVDDSPPDSHISRARGIVVQEVLEAISKHLMKIVAIPKRKGLLTVDYIKEAEKNLKGRLAGEKASYETIKKTRAWLEEISRRFTHDGEGNILVASLNAQAREAEIQISNHLNEIEDLKLALEELGKFSFQTEPALDSSDFGAGMRFTFSSGSGVNQWTTGRVY